MKKISHLFKFVVVSLFISTFLSACDRYQYPLAKIEKKQSQAEYDYKPNINKSGETK